MDHRIALKENTSLRLCSDKDETILCVIEKEIGRGGSCIVYEASRETDTGDKTFYRVKEFYPYDICVSRDEKGYLIPAKKDKDAFHRQQEQFRLDFSRTNRLFYSGSNYAAMTNQLDVFEQNGTSYILSAYSSQKTLSAYRPESIKECANLVKQVAYVLNNIHEQGFLYLDIKPDNVLIDDGLQKQIRLFDFNSLLSMKDLENIPAAGRKTMRLSYSKGFAAIELQMYRVERLGRHTDVYGVGALLFYILFGRTPAAPDCEYDARYDFRQMKYDCRKCDEKLFDVLTEFFHRATAVYYADRYQNMREVLEKLNVIEKYADITLPRIYSTKISRPKYLFGREKEFAQMDALLGSADSNCVFLTGMGGIGKSTFIREYLANRSFDTALYIYYKDSMDATISDDANIEINTIRQDEAGKSDERYFDRKLRKMRELVRGTNSILVIDNFTGKIDADLRAVLTTDLKVVILTRRSLFYQNGREMNMRTISDPDALRKLFEINLGRSITEDEIPDFGEILQRAGRHTLILELIAKQIAASHITLSKAAALTAKNGFSSIAPERIDYERDLEPCRDTIGNIIDALFDAGSLSEEKKTLMKVASLLGDRGMDIHQFQQILQLISMDNLNELVLDGWLMISGDVISMHRVIREAVHRWRWMERYVKAAEQFLSYFYVELRIESTKNNLPRNLKRCCAGDEREERSLRLPDDRIRHSLFASRVRRTGQPKNDPEKQSVKKEIIGKILRERYARATDESPADREKIASLLSQSEDILRECRREEVITANDAYINLRFETVLNTLPYREDYILAETSDIFSENVNGFVLNDTVDFSNECESGNPIAILRLYTLATLIHADNKRFDEAEKLLEQAKNFTNKIHHDRVYAWYYNLLSEYYDILLDGHYDTENAEQEQLLHKLLAAIDKTLRYAKRTLSYDDNHLYAQNILSKTAILMRSGRGSNTKIRRLLGIAKKIITENTSRYADVRLHYYLVCAWYAALVCDNVSLTENFVDKIRELSDAITPTDLQRIENVIIPCANIFFELRCYDRALAFLLEGIQLCANHANTDSYARVKQELCDHLWQVGIEAEAFDICQKMLFLVNIENDAIIDPKNRIFIPDDIQKIITGRTTE